MEVIGSIFGEDAIVHRAPMLNIPALTYYLLQRLSTDRYLLALVLIVMSVRVTAVFSPLLNNLTWRTDGRTQQ